MKKSEFMDEVVRTYYNNDCTVSEAIDITAKQLGISDLELQNWFRGNGNADEVGPKGRGVHQS
ncbi:hypothetical protein Ccar_16695 [Clostridium carboxidivorans P7]|uniref:hypothetical protein n=1 Tax=Clostridium carboxidivorans TaxID=217159 RepID=UPI00064F5A4E|nr:hypothetical protein [Clostridium carboxidivorans]AKN32408.1 hypothetical protein Ccar_16695 [Clostridium carboxidivorans P7]